MNRSMLFLGIEKNGVFISDLEGTDFFQVVLLFFLLSLLLPFLLYLRIVIKLDKSIMRILILLSRPGVAFGFRLLLVIAAY